MKFFTRTAALTALLALSASPAFAQGPPEGTPTADNNPGTAYQQANQPESTPDQTSNPGSDARPDSTPNAENNPGTDARPGSTPNAENNPGTARKLAAPGRFCKDASKKRVEGQKGTAFSACVKAQARLRSGKADSPREACKGASKKHVKGEKGTAFSTCVKAAAKLLKDQKAQEEQGEEQAPEQGEQP